MRRQESVDFAAERSWIDRLACPTCGSPLEESAGKLACAECGKTWPVVDGVPHFVDRFPYWGEMPQEKMQAVNDRAAAGSWRAALLESGDAEVQKAAEMILNLDRANWHWLANVPRDSRVLDLGAGTGTNAHALGLQYREVVAVEPVLERIQFMRERFAQEGLRNVKPVRSSLWTLPFAKESFDLVAMNGVLEWVAVGQPGDPAELQKKAAANVYRLLRPGGCFYLGIENRLAYGSFFGWPDPHCGLPLVTILPRPLAHWYARRRGHSDGYRNYLYSGGGYRRLLESVGFKRIEIYVALPSYNHPRFLIPLDDKVFHYYFQNFGAGQRWHRKLAFKTLMALKLLKYCEHSFVIFGHK
jgi:SAM-dependent methyltransferase